MTRASAWLRCPQCRCAHGTGRGSLRSNELPLAESARLMHVTHCPARPSGSRSRPISREPAAARQENLSTPAPAADPIGRLRQPLSGQPLRHRCASSLRGAPVVTTRASPRPASDCGVQAQVTDPSDGVPAAAGNPGKLFLMTPPQAGLVLQAPSGLIDLAQPDEPAGLRPQQRVQPMADSPQRATSGPRPCRAGQQAGLRHKPGVVPRVPRCSRCALALGTDRNTHLNERHPRQHADPSRSQEHQHPNAMRPSTAAAPPMT